MCFSPTASFAAAAAIGAIGVAVLARTRAARDLPLAAIPLIFAVQQAVEGAVWLALLSDAQGRTAVALAFAFLVFAQVIWPALIPVAVLAVEPRRGRRWALYVIVPVGFVVAGYLLVVLLGRNGWRPRASDLAGSEYLQVFHSRVVGRPVIHLSQERQVQELCRRAIQEGISPRPQRS